MPQAWKLEFQIVKVHNVTDYQTNNIYKNVLKLVPCYI